MEQPQDKRSLLVTATPPEIRNLIFKLFDPVASTCLGLTCKKFYGIHRSFHGSVSLAAKSPDDSGGLSLHQFLDDWICQGFPLRQQISLVYSPVANKFQDLDGIRNTWQRDATEIAGRIEQLTSEYGELLDEADRGFNAFKNTGTIPPNYSWLLDDTHRVQENRKLLRNERCDLCWSLAVSVGLVEVKAKAAVSLLI
jgi:hypothetical protein